MAVVATKLRRGQAIRVKGDTGIILELVHRTPGKGNALIMATVRSFGNGRTKDIRFTPGEKVEVLMIERLKLEFSYQDGSSFFFVDPESFETVELPATMLDEVKDLITENTVCEVIQLDGQAVSVELPATVDLKVTETAEGLRGDTVNNPQKPATLETGKVVQVPLFIKTGEVLSIDTRTGKYLGRS
jgi:elongation factor P